MAFIALLYGWVGNLSRLLNDKTDRLLLVIIKTAEKEGLCKIKCLSQRVSR